MSENTIAHFCPFLQPENIFSEVNIFFEAMKRVFRLHSIQRKENFFVFLYVYFFLIADTLL
jgi:hypothetical protein